jgi:hypothetical protein
MKNIFKIVALLITACSGGNAEPSRSDMVVQKDMVLSDTTDANINGPDQMERRDLALNDNTDTDIRETDKLVWQDLFYGDTTDTDNSEPDSDVSNGTDGDVDASSPECQASTPYQINESCVECLNSNHCVDDELCEDINYTCIDKPAACSHCQGMRPACVMANGILKCVECSKDTDCDPGNFCHQESFTCMLWPNPMLGVCSEDTSCKSNELMDLSLECDQNSSKCFDAFGWCDGIYALCKPGSSCVMLSDISDIDLIFPIPDGGTPENVGLCSCNDTLTFSELGACYDGNSATPCSESPECFTGTCSELFLPDIGINELFKGYCIDQTGYFFAD